jgi:hypothetical protein
MIVSIELQTLVRVVHQNAKISLEYLNLVFFSQGKPEVLCHKYEGNWLLGYDAVWSGRLLPMFRNPQPPSSG